SSRERNGEASGRQNPGHARAQGAATMAAWTKKVRRRCRVSHVANPLLPPEIGLSKREPLPLLSAAFAGSLPSRFLGNTRATAQPLAWHNYRPLFVLSQWHGSCTSPSESSSKSLC